jgi:hypothetical protein
LPSRLSTGSLILAIYRLFHFFHKGAEIVAEGLLLGLAAESAMDEVSEQSYGSGAQYTNNPYLDSGFQFWEKLIVDRFFVPGSRVLVGSAGGGREIIALHRAGFRVDGFECSKAMVNAGRAALIARQLEARLDFARPSAVPVILNRYDAAIIGWNGYTYILPRARRVTFLRDLAAHLEPGSPIVISGAFGVSSSASAIWVPRIANCLRRLTFRTPCLEAGDGFPGRPRHEFSWHQVSAEVSEAGLQSVERYRWGPFFALVCRVS